MTPHLLEKRALTNETVVTFKDGTDKNIGVTNRRVKKTPRKNILAGKPQQWAGAELAANQVDGGAADDDEISDVEGEQAPEEGAGSDDEGEDDAKKLGPAPTNDFYTACSEIWEKIKPEGSEFEPHDNQGDIEIRPPDSNDSDKRKCLVATITGRPLVQMYLMALGIRTGTAAWKWANEHDYDFPVSAIKKTFLGPRFFDEGYLKDGKCPIFGHVTLDEAHGYRNYEAIQVAMAILIPKKTMLLLTGTPLYNSMADFRSYMLMFAAHYGIDIHLELLTDNIHELNGKFNSSEDLIKLRLVGRKEGCNEEFIKALFDWANEDLERRTWWCLLRGFRPFAVSSNETVKLVACRMFARSFFSRRTMSTPLEGLDGRIVYPTTGLLPCKVQTIYVRHNKDLAAILAAVTDLMNAQVKKANEERARRSGGTSAPNPDDSNPDDSNPDPDILSDSKRLQHNVRHVLNMAQTGESTEASALGYNRVLAQVATCHHIFRMYFDPEVNKRDPLHRLTPKEMADVMKVVKHHKDKGIETLPESLARDRIGHARLGKNDVARMASFDNYNGLSYFYSVLNEPGLIASKDVAHMVTWVVSKSPPLFELLRTLQHGFRKPEVFGDRVMIVVQSPLIES